MLRISQTLRNDEEDTMAKKKDEHKKSSDQEVEPGQGRGAACDQSIHESAL